MFFVENLYADVLKQMNGCRVIVNAIVSRVFHIGFTRYFVCGYNELAISTRVEIAVRCRFRADMARMQMRSGDAFPWGL